MQSRQLQQAERHVGSPAHVGGHDLGKIIVLDDVQILAVVRDRIDPHFFVLVHLGLDDLLASLFSLAQMAIGLPYFVARTLGFPGEVKSVTFEYGNTFTAVAGLLNILVVLDAYDTALGRKR